MYPYVVKRIKGGGERPRILIRLISVIKRYPPGFAFHITVMYHAHSDHALMNTVKCDIGHANLQTRARAAPR